MSVANGPARHRARPVRDSPAAGRPTDAPAVADRRSCSTGGTPIRTSTAPRSPRESALAAGGGRAARVPAGAHAVAVLRDHPRGSRRGGRRAGAAARWPDVRLRGRAGGRVGRPVHASLYERAPDDGGSSASTPRSASRPTARCSPGPASPTCRSPPATTRTGTSGPATAATPSSSSPTRASASRPAGTSGSPRSRARTRCTAPRCSSTRPRSAPSPTTPTSTPSRCGSR